MLNIEKYKDNIKALGITRLALQNGEMKMCKEIECHNCDFYHDPDQMCFRSKIDWLCSEYKEPEFDWDNDIDWVRVPADTDVLVNTELEEIWYVRKFALYIPKGGVKYRTYAEGECKEDARSVQAWEFCKLLNPVDVEKYRKNM